MQLILLVLMTSLLAWFIVWAMVKIIFIPVNKITILGFSWEAPIYVWVKQLDISRILSSNDVSDPLSKLMPLIDTRLDDFFRNRLAEKLPMISMFIGDKTIEQLKAVFIAELESLFPEILQTISTQTHTDIVLRLQTDWIKEIEMKLMKATSALRNMAIIIGLLGGFLMHLILSFF